MIKRCNFLEDNKNIKLTPLERKAFELSSKNNHNIPTPKMWKTIIELIDYSESLNTDIK